MKINSIDKNTKSILSSNYYKIPRFQRPYSWTQENISDFWTDTIVDSDTDYFIGSIVVFDLGNDTFGIVDGQQRLSTITMVLCALRNALYDEGFNGLAEAVHHLIERPDINNKPRFVLSTESSFPYFQEYIQKHGEPDVQVQTGDEEKDIASAFLQIRQYIEEAVKSIKNDPTLNEDNKKKQIQEKLISIRDRILNLKVIFIEVDNEDDATTIFETLNTRGKDLNVADLLKAHLTRLLPAKNVSVDTAKIRWEQVLSTIEGSSAEIDIVGFLHHYWLSKYEYTTVKKLYKAIKKKVKKDNAQAFLNELVADAKTYREIHEVTYRKWAIEQQRIRDSLDAFTLFRIKQQVPIVLSVMRDYKSANLKKKEVEVILSSIENFHFLFTAVTSQRSSGGISQMYASSARALVNASTRSDKIAILTDLRDKLKKKIPAKGEFEVNFADIQYSNDYTKQKKLVKYILRRIHQYYVKGLAVDYDRMTIEHICPQGDSDTGLIDYKHMAQLGNLILVPQELNEKLGNKSFVEKKKILDEHKVKLDEALISSSSWTNKQIEDRTEWLSYIAYKEIWKI
jgi:uncharacterized protein with ParB-like and HNH nuclease domain